MTDGKSTSRIRILRQALGLTQTEFGRRVGMSIDEIKNLEYGNTRLKEIKIPLICQTYNVNETWLRTGKGELLNPRQPKEELSAFLSAVLRDLGYDPAEPLANALASLPPKKVKALADLLAGFIAVWNGEEEE